MVVADAPDGGGGSDDGGSDSDTDPNGSGGSGGDTSGRTSPVGGQTQPDRSTSGSDSGGSSGGSSTTSTGGQTSPVGGETPPADAPPSPGDDPMDGRTGTGTGSSPPAGRAPPDGREPDTGEQTSPAGGRSPPRSSEDTTESPDPTRGRTSPVGGNTPPDGGGMDVPEGVSDEEASDIRREVAADNPAVFFSDVQLERESLSESEEQEVRQDVAADVRQDVAAEYGVDPSEVDYTAEDVEFEQEPGRIVASIGEAGRERAAEFDVAQEFGGVAPAEVDVEEQDPEITSPVGGRTPPGGDQRGADAEPTAVTDVLTESAQVSIAAEQTEYSEDELAVRDGEVRLSDETVREEAAEQSEEYGPGDLMVQDGEVRLTDEARRESAAEEFGVAPSDVQIVPPGTGTSPVGGIAPPEDAAGEIRLTDEGYQEYIAESGPTVTDSSLIPGSEQDVTTGQFVAGIGTVDVENHPSGRRTFSIDDPTQEQGGYGDVLGNVADEVGDAASPVTDTVGDFVKPEVISFGVIGEDGLTGTDDPIGDSEATEGVTNPNSPVRNWIQDRGEDFEPAAEFGADVATAPLRFTTNIGEASGLLDEEAADDTRTHVTDPAQRGAASALNVPLWVDDAAAIGQAGSYVLTEGDVTGIPSRAGTVGETSLAVGRTAGRYAAENPVVAGSGIIAGGVAGYGASAAARRTFRSGAQRVSPDGDSSITSSTAQTAARARTRARNLRERSPVGIEIDPDAPLFDINTNLRAGVWAGAERAASAPIRGGRRAIDELQSINEAGIRRAQTQRLDRRERANEAVERLANIDLEESLAEFVGGPVRNTARTAVESRRAELDDVPAGEPLTDPLGSVADRIGGVVESAARSSFDRRRRELGDLETDQAALGPDEALRDLSVFGGRSSGSTDLGRPLSVDIDSPSLGETARREFTSARFGAAEHIDRFSPPSVSDAADVLRPDIPDVPNVGQAARRELTSARFRAAEALDEGFTGPDIGAPLAATESVSSPGLSLGGLSDLTIRVGRRSEDRSGVPDSMVPDDRLDLGGGLGGEDSPLSPVETAGDAASDAADAADDAGIPATPGSSFSDVGIADEFDTRGPMSRAEVDSVGGQSGRLLTRSEAEEPEFRDTDRGGARLSDALAGAGLGLNVGEATSTELGAVQTPELSEVGVGEVEADAAADLSGITPVERIGVGPRGEVGSRARSRTDVAQPQKQRARLRERERSRFRRPRLPGLPGLPGADDDSGQGDDFLGSSEKEISAFVDPLTGELDETDSGGPTLGW